MGTTVRLFVQRLRLSNPWNYKLPLLMTMPYFLMNAQGIDGWRAVALFLCALLTAIGFAGFGYATNDLSDVDADQAASKENSAIAYGKSKMILAAGAFLLLALLPWLYLPSDAVSLVLILLEILLFTLYAFPPFRWKNRGFLGALTDTFYAYVAPAILATWTFYLAADQKMENIIFVILPLSSWLLFVGLRGIVYHQLADFENDALVGSRNWVQRLGKQKAETTVIRQLFMEIGIFVCFLVLLSQHGRFLPLLFGLWIFYGLYRFRKNRATSTEPTYKQWTNVFLDQSYTEWLPLVVLFTIGLPTWSTWVMLAFHLLLFRSPIKDFIKGINRLVRASWAVRKFEGLSTFQQGLIHLAIAALFYLLYTCLLTFIIQTMC